VRHRASTIHRASLHLRRGGPTRRRWVSPHRRERSSGRHEGSLMRHEDLTMCRLVATRHRCERIMCRRAPPQRRWRASIVHEELTGLRGDRIKSRESRLEGRCSTLVSCFPLKHDRLVIFTRVAHLMHQAFSSRSHAARRGVHAG
jgi:hypothetical protein